MMRFTPLIETTPEPVPEVILTYDTSCLPPAIPAPEPTPIPPQDENEGLSLITIPPLEGEFLELEIGELNEPEQPEERFEERMLIHVGYPASSATYGIYSADPTNGDVSPLLTGLNLVHNVILSPNGRYIAFSGFIFESPITNNGLFVMKSDGSDLRQIGIPGTAYGSIGWTADSQYVTYSVGSENKTYGQHPNPLLTDVPIVLLEEGIRPKWIDMGVNKVIYTSNGYLYVTSFDPITLQVGDEPAQITTTPVGRYAWANQGMDIIFDLNGQLWYYRDEVVSLAETTSEEPIGHLSWMTTPLGFHFVTVKPDGGGSITSGGVVNLIPYNYQIQRIRFASGNTIQMAQPVLNNGNLYYPFLSPYRNLGINDQDIYYASCYSSHPPNGFGFQTCTESYILNANSIMPRRIFENTPVAGSPVVAWQEFIMPESSAGEPTEIVCVAPSTTNPSGFRVRDDASFTDLDGDGVHEVSFPGTNIIFNINSLTNVGIIYIQQNNNGERWYRVRFDSNNDGSLDSLGWMGGDPFSNFGDCDRIPVLDETYEPISLATYDYPLPPPPPEEDWLNRDCLDGVPQLPGMSDSLHYDLQVANWRECSKIVYFIYYNIMLHVYGSEPLLSDALTSIYGTELSLYFQDPRRNIMGLHGDGASGKNAYELSIEALSLNYWISCDLANCHPAIGSPITSETAIKLVNQYLYSINAWYADALTLQDWYSQFDFANINLAQDMREQVNTLTTLARSTALTPEQRLNLNGFRAFLDLIPDNRYQQIGIQSLDAVVYETGNTPRQWGNHGYNREGYVEIYTNYNTSTGFRHDNRIVLCIKNVTWVDNGNATADPGDKWSDDIFVMITVRSLYPTSFYDREISGIPDWSEIKPMPPYSGSQAVSCDTALNLEKKE